VATSKRVGWLPAEPQIEAAAFLPDGKTLITAAVEQSAATPHDPFRVREVLQQWEVGTGRPLNRVVVERSSSPGRSFMAFSQDGKLFLATDGEKKLRLWDALSGKPLLEIEQDVTYWNPFALSDNGKMLAVLGSEGDLHLYETATGKQVQRIQCPEDGSVPYGYFGPALSPDGKTLVASTQNSLRLWNAATGEMTRENSGCRGLVAFTGDGKYLACGDAKAIRLLEANSLREVRRFEEHHDRIMALAFSADGKFLVTGQDHAIGLWDVVTGKQLNALPGHHEVVYSLAFTPDGKGLASGAQDGMALVWDLSTEKPRHALSGHYLAPVSLAFSPDGKLLATGDGQPYVGHDSREAQIRLWDLDGGRLLRQFTGHIDSVQSLAFSPDGKLLASGGGDARFRVWDPATGKRLYQVRGGEGRWQVSFSPDGGALLVGNTSGELGLWQPDTGKKLRELEGGVHGHIVHAVFVGDGKTVVCETQGRGPGQLSLCDADTGREVRSFALKGSSSYYSNAVSGHAVSLDGTLAATATQERQNPAIQLWDVASGQLLAVLHGHTGEVTALAFSPDGKTLASGSWDTTVLLWDVPRARLIGLWFRLNGDPQAAAEAGKGLAANPEGAVRFLAGRLRRAAALEGPYARLIVDLDDDRFEVREQASHRLEEAGAEAEFALRLALEGQPSAEVKRRVERALGKLTSAREAEVTGLLADVDGGKSRDAWRRLDALGPVAEPILRRLLEQSRVPRPDRKEVPSRAARWMIEQVLERLNEPDNSMLPMTPAGVQRAVAILEQIGTPEARQALEELAKGPADAKLTRQATAALRRLGK
jgi:WD40 repeat protein